MSPATPAGDAYQLLSVIGHDLRTPLTVMRGAATLLIQAGSELEPERATAMLRLIDQQVEVMSDRIEDLLTMSALEADQLRLHLSAVAADDLLHRLAEWTSRREDGDRVLIADGSPIRLEADADRVYQALRAMVQNALRHAPGQEPIEVKVVRAPGGVRFQVLDRGPGLPPGMAAFQRFASGGSGAGLGLYMVRRLVELMDGEASFRPRPGGGSAFSFTLRRRG